MGERGDDQDDLRQDHDGNDESADEQLLQPERLSLFCQCGSLLSVDFGFLSKYPYSCKIISQNPYIVNQINRYLKELTVVSCYKHGIDTLFANYFHS